MDDAIAHLYQLPLDQFTPARNALAKSAGPRAAEIKAIEKPHAAAWAANQLFWLERPVYDELIEASRQLRAAYRDQLAGKSPDMRGAEATHKAAVKCATQTARDARHPPQCRPADPAAQADRLRGARGFHHCPEAASRTDAARTQGWAVKAQAVLDRARRAVARAA